MPRFDPTITQKVRASLIEDGHSDLVIETLTEGLQEMEQKIHDLQRDVKLLQDAERDRLTQSGVWLFVRSKLDQTAVDWGVWAVRGSLAAAGAIVIAIAFKIFSIKEIP